MTTEEKALALVNAVLAERGIGKRRSSIDRITYPMEETICRAIEAHEADKKAFSDAVKSLPEHIQQNFRLLRFILPEPEPDPLVEVFEDIGWATESRNGHRPDRLRKALAARGYKIERIEQ